MCTFLHICATFGHPKNTFFSPLKKCVFEKIFSARKFSFMTRAGKGLEKTAHFFDFCIFLRVFCVFEISEKRVFAAKKSESHANQKCKKCVLRAK